MVNVKDEDPAALVVDAIPDSVLTASGTPETFEGSVQWSADAMRFTSKRAVDELPGRKRGAGREAVAQSSPRAG